MRYEEAFRAAMPAVDELLIRLEDE